MAKRSVDKRKTAKALRKLRRAAERASEEGGSGLTAWEKDFVEGVSGRLEKYGSAFRDPGKGRLEEALSQRQSHVARVIDRKSRPKTPKTPGSKALAKSAGGAGPKPAGLRRSGLKRKTPMGGRHAPRVRDVNEDPETTLALDPAISPEKRRAALRLVPGGKPGGKAG